MSVAGRPGLADRWVATGELSVDVSERFALEDAAEAHRRVEARATTGKVVLIP